MALQGATVAIDGIRMTPAEYRAALATLGLSQLAAGRWLGVSPKTAQNYANDSQGPSGPAARAIGMLLDMTPAARAKAMARPIP